MTRVIWLLRSATPATPGICSAVMAAIWAITSLATLTRPLVGWNAGAISVISGPLHVFAGSGVDLDPIALVDEQGHRHRQPGLQRRRLRGPGRGVALEAGVGCGHLEIDGGGQFDPDRLVLVGQNGDLGAVFEVFEGVTKGRGRQRYLVVGLGVHEVVLVAVAIEILHVSLLDAYLGEALLGTKSLVGDGPSLKVAQASAHLGGAPPHLHVRVADADVQLSVALEDRAVAQVASVDHEDASVAARAARNSSAWMYPWMPLPLIIATHASLVTDLRRH